MASPLPAVPRNAGALPFVDGPIRSRQSPKSAIFPNTYPRKNCRDP